jgi:hypothetical protein
MQDLKALSATITTLGGVLSSETSKFRHCKERVKYLNYPDAV